MPFAPRVAIAAPAIAGLMLALVASARMGAAALVQSTGAPEDLARALEWTPGDPSLHERVGLSMARGAGHAPDASRAYAAIAKSLELRPVSAYSWAALAEGMYRAGAADETFQGALERASMLGPNEPAVQDTVAFYGLALWDELSPGARAATRSMVAAGMKRDPEAMLRIAQRRGRLDAACGAAEASPAAAAKWPQLCRSRETTR